MSEPGTNGERLDREIERAERELRLLYALRGTPNNWPGVAPMVDKLREAVAAYDKERTRQGGAGDSLCRIVRDSARTRSRGHAMTDATHGMPDRVYTWMNDDGTWAWSRIDHHQINGTYEYIRADLYYPLADQMRLIERRLRQDDACPVANTEQMDGTNDERNRYVALNEDGDRIIDAATAAEAIGACLDMWSSTLTAYDDMGRDYATVARDRAALAAEVEGLRAALARAEGAAKGLRQERDMLNARVDTVLRATSEVIAALTLKLHVAQDLLREVESCVWGCVRGDGESPTPGTFADGVAFVIDQAQHAFRHLVDRAALAPASTDVTLTAEPPHQGTAPKGEMEG